MVTFSVQSKEFDAYIKDAVDKVGDLRPALITIAKEFYKAQQSIFKLKSKGQYDDFTGPKISETWKNPGRPDLRTRDGSMTAYQFHKTKQKHDGVNAKGYPLLKATGKLEQSLVDEKDSNAIQEITKRSLVIGTKVSYGAFHQLGTKNIPMRQFLFIDPSTTVFAGSKQFSRRNEAWVKAIELYVARTLGIKPKGGSK